MEQLKDQMDEVTSTQVQMPKERHALQVKYQDRATKVKGKPNLELQLAQAEKTMESL